VQTFDSREAGRGFVPIHRSGFCWLIVLTPVLLEWTIIDSMPLEELEGFSIPSSSPPPRRPIARATTRTGGSMRALDPPPITPVPPVRRPRGRPRSETRKKTMNLTLRLLRPFYGELKTFARKQGMPPGQVVMYAVEFYIRSQENESMDSNPISMQPLAAVNGR
jgi:hypothetical protein